MLWSLTGNVKQFFNLAAHSAVVGRNLQFIDKTDANKSDFLQINGPCVAHYVAHT
jgi:hypothetical protein